MAKRYQPRYGTKRTQSTATPNSNQGFPLPDTQRQTSNAGGLRPRLRSLFCALGVTLGTAAVIAVCCFAARLLDPYNIKPIPGQDPHAVNGTLVSNAREKVETGHYRIVINMSPIMARGTDPCSLNIENVLGNEYVVKVELTDESGSTLYSSGYIQPGQRIMDVHLDKALPKGEHTATASYSLFQRDTLEARGATATAITITVQG